MPFSAKISRFSFILTGFLIFSIIVIPPSVLGQTYNSAIKNTSSVTANSSASKKIESLQLPPAGIFTNNTQYPITALGNNLTLRPSYEFSFTLLDNPPQVSKEEQNRSLMELEEIDPIPPLPNQTTSVSTQEAGPKLGPEVTIKIENETTTNSFQQSPKPAGYDFIGAGDFVSINRLVSLPPGSPHPLHVTPIAEPAVANSGTTNIVFYTGNHFAARSDDGGRHWSYMNPKEDGFDNAGDNDVIYSSKAERFMWYRQGISGSFSLGISADAQNWAFYNMPAKVFYPEFAKKALITDQQKTMFDSQGASLYPLNPWFDYPQLQLSDDGFFFSTNIYLGCQSKINNLLVTPDPKICETLGVTKCDPTIGLSSCSSGNKYIGSFIMRYNLNEIGNVIPGSSHPSLNLGYFFDSGGRNYGLVQGAGPIMYWATQTSNDKLRIYSWRDGGADILIAVRNIHPFKWASAKDPSDCSITGSPISNWCERNGQFITGGWIENGRIGFLWNVPQGCVSDSSTNLCVRNHKCTAVPDDEECFAWPHIEAATFNIGQNYYYEERPTLFNNNFAIQYAFASPAIGMGHSLAIMYWIGGGTPEDHIYPSLVISLDDFYERYTAGHLVYKGKDYDGKRWGDYLRVRPYGDNRIISIPPLGVRFGTGQGVWVGSGYVDSSVSPFLPSIDIIYFIFGRDADMVAGMDLNQSPSMRYLPVIYPR